VGGAGSPRSAFGLDLYYCAGKALTCAANNGNIRTASLAAPGVDQNFTYDPLNRLLSAAEGTAWAEGFSYDQFGNRWVDTSQTSGVTVSSFTATANSNFDANNRLQIMSSQYDGAGNQKQVGAYAFTWDAEGRMAASALTSGQTASTTTYVYDGDGRRVMKQGATATVYVYDAMGQLAAEYGGTPAPSCGTCYVTVDQLGSTRAVTDGATGNVVERHDYLPFGEELYAGTGGRTTALQYQGAGTPGALTQRFTGKERDAETASSAMPDGLDYFGARYFSGAQGRFTGPDPSNLSVDWWVPQSWNRYTYALNNPLAYVDENGLWPTWIHNQIIRQAFPGLTEQQLQTLIKASHDTDYANKVSGLDPQDPAASYVHGMTDGLTGQSASKAESDGDAFISGNELRAESAQASWLASGHTGISPNALTAFGNGLHTVTDRTSPTHRGNQPWYGTTGALNVGRAIQHVAGESIIRNEPAFQSGIQSAREFFLETFGADAYVAATKKKEVVTTKLCTADSDSGKKVCQ
jgi:RHS repeat-associated protein